MMPSCAAIIVAAGRGQRFGAETPKQYALLAGQPVLRRTLEGFARHGRVQQVLTVIHPDDTPTFAATASGLAVMAPVNGGATRQESVLRGLEALAAAPPDVVLIHDGARPMVSAGLIDTVLEGLTRADGAIPALPVTDTLKHVNAEGRIGATVSRDGLMRAQTPQGFHFDAIFAAHRKFAGESLTDDAAVMERAGHRVITVPGDPANVKVTTPGDLAQLNASVGVMRVGQGFDVHRFTDGDHVTLCGVKIPHTHKLLGHSDADAGLHALTDAILGAIGAGDIGVHFPPSNPAYKDAPSDIFLRHARDMVAARGGEILHVDVTIICERPKVGPHRAAMTAAIAAILGLPEDRVSVKATTTEGLGFTGRNEGIAAQAVATVRT